MGQRYALRVRPMPPFRLMPATRISSGGLTKQNADQLHSRGARTPVCCVETRLDAGLRSIEIPRELSLVEAAAAAVSPGKVLVL